MYKYTNSPYKEIPTEIIPQFTLNEQIPILNFFKDDSKTFNNSSNWNESLQVFLNRFTISNVFNNNIGIEDYPGASRLLIEAFFRYDIKQKKVAVIGSLDPWIEAMLLNLDNTVITVEYNVPTINHDKLSAISYTDFQQNPKIYDVIVSFSSIEHSGLGRYGDPLDPEGDIKAMEDIHKNLKENGLLILGIPVGTDTLVWNVHRIYGRKRLPIIFKGFQEKEWIGYNKEEILNRHLTIEAHIQPVIVLEKL